MSNIFNLNNDIVSELKKYPRRMERIVDLLETLLNKYKEKSNDAVIKMILYQEAMINTHHPDFIKAVIEADFYKEFFLSIKLNRQQMIKYDFYSRHYFKNEKVYIDFIQEILKGKMRKTVKKEITK
jgi:hypothetical protein